MSKTKDRKTEALERALPWLRKALAERLEEGTAAPNDLTAVIGLIEHVLIEHGRIITESQADALAEVDIETFKKILTEGAQ